VLCEGVEFHVFDRNADLVYAGMVLYAIIKKIHPQFELLPPFKEGSHRFINLLVGDIYLEQDIIDLKQIKQRFEESETAFKRLKEKYHLYEL
jgi:uncharacterized protein YbbC (DUF1343 family)